MIKVVENEYDKLKKICSHDVFGTRIEAYYDTYDKKFDFLKIWIQLDENGNPLAAVSLMDNDMTVTCRDNADFDELEIFIKMTDFASLQCGRDILKRLNIKESLWGYVVSYDEIMPVKNDNIDFSVDYKEMYSLISSVKLLGVGEYLPWLSDITYRVNHGTAVTASVTENGTLSACAAALFITDKSALLGAVATNPQCRGRGLGGSLVKILGNKMLESGRRVELLCKNDSIVEFYKSAGFRISGEWAISGQ